MSVSWVISWLAREESPVWPLFFGEKYVKHREGGGSSGRGVGNSKRGDFWGAGMRREGMEQPAQHSVSLVVMESCSWAGNNKWRGSRALFCVF